MSIKSRFSTGFSTILAAVLMSVAGAAIMAPLTTFAADEAAAPAAAAAPAPDAAAAPAAASTTAAAPDATLGAPVAEPTVVKESVENKYGPQAMWRDGDIVTHGTAVMLFIMSMGSWYILITKLLDQLKMMGQGRDAAAKFWKTNSINAGIKTLKEGSPYRFIAENGVKSTEHHDGALLEQIDLNSWVTVAIQRSVEKVQSRLQDGLSFLATVGSTAPFVGLFGTVWGIYNALIKIAAAGQPSIDKVAGPVGEALIMTAAGLFVAVPAVLGYNWLVRRNKGAMEDIRSFSTDLHSVLLSGVMSSSEQARASATKVG